MARTVAEIYDAIIAYKDNQTFLQDLTPQNDTAQQLANDMNSDSKTAIWRLWAYCTAVAIYVHETLWDIAKVELNTIAANAITGTIRWYQEQVFLFQFGDSLTYINGKYQYPVIDLTKRIVKRCAVNENQNGALLIKVAKLNGAQLLPLAATETAALQSYMSKVRFAGTPIQVISGNGDHLRLALDIYFDPIIPESIVHDNVKIAISNYTSGLTFNGVFRIIQLIDAIQTVEGVKDIFVQDVRTRLSAAANWQPISYAHTPYYGYYQIDNSAGNTLDDTLAYYSI